MAFRCASTFSVLPGRFSASKARIDQGALAKNRRFVIVPFFPPSKTIPQTLMPRHSPGTFPRTNASSFLTVSFVPDLCRFFLLPRASGATPSPKGWTIVKQASAASNTSPQPFIFPDRHPANQLPWLTIWRNCFLPRSLSITCSFSPNSLTVGPSPDPGHWRISHPGNGSCG